MKKLSLNKGWTVRSLSREGPARRVDVPHDAMLDEPRVLASRGGDHIGWYVGDDYEYTRPLPAPVEWAGMKVVLEFEGVYHGAEVFVNGEKAIVRPSGYAGFQVDVSSYLRYGGENQLRVVAHNSDQPNSRWYTGTGIYRPVNLWLGGAEHIRLYGVKVRPVDCETGAVEVLARLSRPGEVTVELLDGGAVVASRTHTSAKRSVLFRMAVDKPVLWEPENPHLYTCRVTFGGDVVRETFGFRTLKWSAGEGLLLNGRPLRLRGACVHHDNGPLGACAFPEAEARKVRLLKALGFNAIRSAHNPCSKALLNACDRLGMLVVDEYADAWYIRKTPFDYARVLQDWWQDDLKDMVDKDYNHPSVVMYSIGNEVAETAQLKGVHLAEEMVRTLRELDGTRPVTCAVNPFFNLLSAMGMGVYTNKKTDRSGARAGWLIGLESRLMKWGNLLPGCDRVTREVFARLDVAGYNYGVRRYRRDLRRHPNRLILGTESFWSDAWRYGDAARDDPRILGDFVWCGMDYIGQTGLVAPEYGDYRLEGEEARMTGGFGLMDITGKPRAEAAWYRAAMGLTDAPVMAVLPVDRDDAPEPNGWCGNRAQQSWSWPGCEGRKAVVEVYARGAEVELTLNGVHLGRKPIHRSCRTPFEVRYAPGKLIATTYAADGSPLGECVLTSAAGETELRLLPETPTARPGGLCFVRVRFTDPAGIWKPTEHHRLTAAAESGIVAGFCSGNAYVAGNYNAETTDSYYGEALAIIRAGEGSAVALTVTSENGLTARIEIPIK